MRGTGRRGRDTSVNQSSANVDQGMDRSFLDQSSPETVHRSVNSSVLTVSQNSDSDYKERPFNKAGPLNQAGPSNQTSPSNQTGPSNKTDPSNQAGSSNQASATNLQQLERPSMPSRSRKRQRKPEQWKKSVRKESRNAGKEYVTRKGKTMAAKKHNDTYDCNCRMHCVDNISITDRKSIFDNFWSLTWESQEQVIVSSIIWNP